MSNATRGVLYVHSAPSAMCPHVEWAVAGVLGMPAPLAWSPQPAEQGTYRCELSWQGPSGLAATLTSTLRSWDRLRFEVTEEATARGLWAIAGRAGLIGPTRTNARGGTNA